MCMKSTLHARRVMVSKFFFTLVLSLFIMGNAYSKNAYIYIKNKIPPGDAFYSKKGYTVEAYGEGACMYGVYNPASHTATYEEKKHGRVGIHYAASDKCAFEYSTQVFIVTNNDTGNVVGIFQWRKKVGNRPYIKMINNPDRFMIDATLRGNQPNELNIRCLPK